MVTDTKLFILRYFFLMILYPITVVVLLKNRVTVKKIILLVLSWAPIFLLLMIGDVFNVVMVIGLYAIFKSHKPDLFVFNSIILAIELCDLVYFSSEIILKNSIYSIPNIGDVGMACSTVLTNIILLMILLYIIKKVNLITIIHDKSNGLLFSLMLYLYVVTRAAIFISGYFGVFATTITIINIILIVQAIFTVIIFLIISHNQKKKYDFELLKNQFDTLNDYTAELEHSQEVNAKFKHDYKNLLLSLKSSAESKSSSELINTISDLEQYSDNYFKKIEVDFRHCQNIKNDYLKSLIISKLSKAKQKEIDCHLECQMMIDKMPIDQFDCVRMFGIVLDNAIEAAVETVNPRIDIMLYQNDDQLEFLVKNNYVANTLDLKALKQANISTKKGHSGLGLANIEEISQKHPNILKNFSKKEDIFSANIKILFN